MGSSACSRGCLEILRTDLGGGEVDRIRGAVGEIERLMGDTAERRGRWDDDAFEHLLYDLLRDFPEHQNVQWLMQTRAPDRGRDLSLERVLQDGTGGVRTERIIVQAKHWLKRSVAPAEIAATLAGVKLWQPPVVRGLVIATSGRFSADAVKWAEQHNDTGAAPFIELWPESKLEGVDVSLAEFVNVREVIGDSPSSYGRQPSEQIPPCPPEVVVLRMRSSGRAGWDEGYGAGPDFL